MHSRKLVSTPIYLSDNGRLMTRGLAMRSAEPRWIALFEITEFPVTRLPHSLIGKSSLARLFCISFSPV